MKEKGSDGVDSEPRRAMTYEYSVELRKTTKYGR